MRIKALHMQGFKSFADKTTLDFDRQVLGIVGPNGCGKSNIVDAIRWVMGEQSAKGLRGNDMSDVIFNGTTTRKRANFAEVSLIFDNKDHQASAPYTDCDEIMITRRLYRTGESEYLINKVAVRLKDITDLFLGTGSSAKAYSIVAQGKIDQIVLAKPEDRRGLIEEAAGIAKYKVRKAAAERKMEATEANLARVKDILQELERNARSLERQVERAEKFRKLQTELRVLDEQVIAAKAKRVDDLAQELDQKLGVAREQLAAASTRFSSLEAEIESLKLRALELEKASGSELEQLLKFKQDFSDAETQIQLSTQRRELLARQVEDRKKDIERIQQKATQQSEKVQQLIEERRTVAEEHAQHLTVVTNLKAQIEELDRQSGEMQSRLKVAQEERDQKRAAAVKAEERKRGLQAERIQREFDRAGIESQIEELDQSEAQSQGRRAEAAADLEAIQGDLEKLEIERRQRSLEMEETQQKIDELSEEVRALEQQIVQINAERESLRTLEAHRVGYDLGAEERKTATGGVLVHEVVRFKPEFRALAEGFLEEFGQMVLESDETLPQGLSSQGRRWQALAAGIASSSSFRSLWEAVESCQSSQVEELLRSVEWVNVLSTEPSAHLQIDSEGRLRIPTGSLQRLTLGALSTQDSRFARELALQELDQLVVKRGQLKGEIEEEIRGQKAALMQVRGLLHDVEATRKQIENFITELKQKITRETTMLESLRQQKEAAAGRIVQLDEKISELGREIASIDVSFDLANLESEIQSLEQSLKQLVSDKQKLDQDFIEKRIVVGALEDRLQRLQEQTQYSEVTQSEYQHNQQVFTSDIEIWTNEMNALQQKSSELAEGQEGRKSQIQELEVRLAAMKTELNQVRSDLDQREAARKADLTEKEQAQEAVQSLELERQKLKFEISELAQRLDERYHMSLPDLMSMIPAEVFEKLADETILRSLEVEAMELREQVEKFGDVNLLALSEFEEIKSRVSFMQTQQADLLKTLETLASIIDRINRVTEIRFRETFQAINHNFQILFPKLFGGGRAFMTLSNEHDMLETGVEIFAEPPGKKVQVMSLLSGGEKALTSISLILALFAFKPASFCILDEVDAPLDEVNTTRYSGIIAEMASLSQFIVITHNKRTMEIAEKLFGVTMQEPGCSQIVSVQLQEAQAFVA